MNTLSVLTKEQIKELGEAWSCFFPEIGSENDCLRDVEQKVLQSDQIKAWKKDAERYQFWRNNAREVLDGGQAIDLIEAGGSKMDSATDRMIEELE